MIVIIRRIFAVAAGRTFMILWFPSWTSGIVSLHFVPHFPKSGKTDQNDSDDRSTQNFATRCDYLAKPGIDLIIDTCCSVNGAPFLVPFSLLR